MLCPIKDVTGRNSEKITVCTVYTKAVVRTPIALTVYFEDIEANVDKRVHIALDFDQRRLS